MRDTVLVNCTNYFNEVGCKRLSSELENGKSVRIHIDCIGHTATKNETENYIDWLKETYRDKLVEDKDTYGDEVFYLK